jgi:hypothetical protein
MVSRSALNKSRAILICILVIGSVVEVGAYYIVQNYTSYSSASTVTSFLIDNITINPYEVLINHPVNISVGITNLADAKASYSLSLKINDSNVETKKLSFIGNESKIVTFSVTESDAGVYNASIGEQFGMFNVVTKPSTMPTTLKVSNLVISTHEIWPDQPDNVSIQVTNTANASVTYPLPILVNNQAAQTVEVDLAAGEATNFAISLSEAATGSYQVTVGGQSAKFNVVEAGKHTLHVVSGYDSMPFSLDGADHSTPYSSLIDAGSHTVTVPSSANLDRVNWGIVTYTFNGWGDGVKSTSRTIDLQDELYLGSNWVRVQTSCPSLSVWNGTAYSYASEVSDGTGWLGYLEYFKADGTMVFSNNYPWDYIKLNPTTLQPQNGFYSMKIGEMSNEIFYLDAAKLIAVDHPAGTDVFSTTSTYMYDLSGQGAMYTVSKNPAAPVSAVNGTGQNVLPQISKIDGVYTSGTRWAWGNLTLNLGDLSGAKEIKLVFAAKIFWPTTSAGGSNFMSYANKPGVMPSPPPYMEVKAANGTWIRVPDDRQFPLPDATDNTFVVNLTGLFPSNNYELRINTYQDIRFDYIGVDTTTQQTTSVHTIMPQSADLQQAFTTGSNSSGAFTRYGDVTALMQSADDKFVIGREGDVVTLQFPANLPSVPQGMVRDYFVIASCWFKGNGLPYVPFTVDPMPFQAMTSFPYPSNEKYPYDSAHNAYLKTYNTRIINSNGT